MDIAGVCVFTLCFETPLFYSPFHVMLNCAPLWAAEHKAALLITTVFEGASNTPVKCQVRCSYRECASGPWVTIEATRGLTGKQSALAVKKKKTLLKSNCFTLQWHKSWESHGGPDFPCVQDWGNTPSKCPPLRFIYQTSYLNLLTVKNSTLSVKPTLKSVALHCSFLKCLSCFLAPSLSICALR